MLAIDLRQRRLRWDRRAPTHDVGARDQQRQRIAEVDRNSRADRDSGVDRVLQEPLRPPEREQLGDRLRRFEMGKSCGVTR